MTTETASSRSDFRKSVFSGLQSFFLNDGTEVLVLETTGDSGETRHILSPAPRLVRRQSGGPLFSLSLILKHRPGPQEKSIHPLIDKGLLTMDCQVGVLPAVLEKMKNYARGEIHRLFTRKVDYELVWKEDGESSLIITRAEGSGTEARAGIIAYLDRWQSLDVLSALDRNPSRLNLEATVQYRGGRSSKVIRLTGSWSRIHDFFTGQVNSQGRLSEAELHRLIPLLSEKGLISVHNDNDNPADIPEDILIQFFMRNVMVIMRREAGMDGVEPEYILRGRPHESFHLNYTETITGPALQSHKINASLDQMIGGMLDEYKREDFVHLIAEQANHPAMTGYVPSRVRSTPPDVRNRREGSMKLAKMGNSVSSFSLATRPDTSAIVHPNPSVIHKPEIVSEHVMLDDVRIELPQKERPVSLPVVHDVNAPWWHDRMSQNKCWYAPEFELISPSPTDDPVNSSFLFSFRRTGVTSTGEPALRASIRLSLRQVMSKETSSALSRENHDNNQPVSFETLSVFLLIPFIDQESGQVRVHVFSAVSEEIGGTVTATLSLLNDWVRLAYGALAMEGFQSIPPRVRVAYTFRGYVPVREKDLELAYGGKALYTPVLYSASDVNSFQGRSFFDATTLTYVQPKTELRYHRETDGHVTRSDRKASPDMLARPTSVAVKPVLSTAAVVRPQLEIVSSIATLLQKVKYSIRTQVRWQTMPVLLPCNRLGRFYQEIRNGVPATIGCQNALTLGETLYRQYEEIIEMRTSRYRVYRSLQQPGHFLVNPAAYCIGRRSANESDPYRPLLFLHALIDTEVPANNQVEMRTTLQPDLFMFERKKIFEILQLYDPQPVIHYPTEVTTESVITEWLVDPSITTETLEANSFFISAYFRMDLPRWQLTKNILNHPGLMGSVRFEFFDGTILEANLMVKLDHIRGPWEQGPLEKMAGNGKIKITNRSERTIDIRDLVQYSGRGIAQKIPVEISLSPGQTHTVQASNEMEPVYSYPPGDPVAIEEIRSFVEDIHSNIIFINLLNMAQHNLIRLDVEARIQGINEQYRAQLTGDMPVADIPVILPLTTYLENRTLEFRVIKIFSNKQAEMTEWMVWDLDTTVPVSLTQDLLDL